MWMICCSSSTVAILICKRQIQPTLASYPTLGDNPLQKPFIIGRKNWLFANTPRGAKASAITYSIIETAKENGLNPFQYLIYLFERLPNLDLEDKDALDELLPWSNTLPYVCRMNN
ncbi:hypothetical protein MHOCP_15210 [Moorella humiferrea]